jgi:hypothetical protein
MSVPRRPARRIGIHCASLAIFVVAAAFLIASNAPATSNTPATAACGGTLPSCTRTTSLFFQNLGHNDQQVAQVSLTAVQQKIWSIEDRLQCLIGDAERHAGAAEPRSGHVRRSSDRSGCHVKSPSAADRSSNNWDADNFLR